MKYELRDWGSAPNPGVYRLCFPQNGQKKQATEKCRPFRGKIRTAAQVALLRCRILPYGKANYIINNCLEDYSIYTVCATLPVATLLSGFRSAPSGLKMLLRKNPCKKSVNLS